MPDLSDWTNWLMLGGRGAGKTRAGAEWIRGIATRDPLFGEDGVRRIALVGENYADVRDVMIEGESGLLAVHPKSDRPVWRRSLRKLEWQNGAVAHVFSSEDPEGLRGPQFSAAWCDEFCKWTHLGETWNMLQFALRLGPFPRQVITTTPRPLALLKGLMNDSRTLLTRTPSADNAQNLAKGFLDRIVGQYRGTRLGRQELDAELIEDRPDALWQRDVIERERLLAAPALRRIVVAVDPPVTAHKNSDACGLVVAGVGGDGRAYILEDATIAAVSPIRWAKAAVDLYHRFEADRIVVETNQGGDMVETVLRTIEPALPIRQVRAKRGKWTRAEPVAALYEQGRVCHVGCFGELEDEMCDLGIDGLSTGRSPDRMDAMVWAVFDLMLAAESAEPRVRLP